MSSAPFNISSLVADSHMNVASSFGRQGSSSSSSKSDYNQWESILNLVKDKNMKEKQAMSSMTDFVKSYELLFEHFEALQTKNKTLEKELAKRASQPSMSSQLAPAQQQQLNQQIIELAREKAELEKKLYRVQDELSVKYKEGEQKATAQIKMMNDLQEKKHEIDSLNRQLEESKQQTIYYKGLVAQQKKEIDEVDTLREELKNTRIRLKEAETKARTLENDVSQLTHKILSEKDSTINELNEMNKECAHLRDVIRAYEEGKINGKADLKSYSSSPSSLPSGGTASSLIAAVSAAGAGKDAGASASQGKTSTSDVSNVGVSRIGFHVTKVPKRVSISFKAHDVEISNLCFSENGDTIYTASSDGKVSSFDSYTGVPQKTFHSNQGPDATMALSMMCVDQRGDFVVAGSVDKACRVWSVPTGRLLHTFAGHQGKIYASRISSDVKYVATGSVDRKIMTWDMTTGFRTRTILPGSICNSVDLSDDGVLLVSGHQDRSIRLYDLRSGQTTQTCSTAHESLVTSTRFSADNQSILSSSKDNTLALFDIRNLQVPVIRFAHELYETTCNWSRSDASPDCRYVVGGGANGSLFVWDTSRSAAQASSMTLGSSAGGVPYAAIKEVIPINKIDPASITSVAWSPRGMTVAASDRIGSITVFGQ